MSRPEKRHGSGKCYADGKLFDDVGRYLVLFQALEAYMDKMMLLAIGPNRYHIGRAVISKLSNRDKIDVLNAAVLHSQIRRKSEAVHPEWLGSFKSFVVACKTEAETRNALAHSNFLYDLVKIGGPVMNTRTTLGKEGIRIRNNAITEETMQVSLKRVSELCVEANFMHVQLVHWSDLFDQDFLKPEVSGGNEGAAL